MRIAGSAVLLTGASGGIGGAIAVELAARGARLVVAGRDAARLDALARTLRTGGTDILAIASDIAAPDEPARLAEEARRHAGEIDILINCAGVQNFGFFAEENHADTAALFAVNTVAPLALIQALLPSMLRNGRGQIVNVGSIFGSIGFPCFATYSASKFALRGFSEALRRELAGSGVCITYIAPRFTRTAFNRSAVSRMADALRMRQDEPATVARSVVRAIAHDDRNDYLGWPEKFFVRLNSLLPRLVDGSLMKQVERMRPFATDAGR